jgi:tRNA1Val (adenine37-N6)-methyltransferase
MNQVFRCKKFELYQNEEVFKITTDSMALGASIDCTGCNHVLEVGTGTGIISLMLAQRNELIKITAIDNSTAAISLANRNFKHSPWSAKLKAIHADFNHYDFEETVFDLIVSNPPFYPKGPLPQSEIKKNSKHDISDITTSIVSKAKTLLIEHGQLWLILPDYLEPEISSLALENGLFLKKHISIHPTPSLPANRVIVCYTKQKDITTNTASILVYTEDRTYHASWQDLLKDYMIIF